MTTAIFLMLAALGQDTELKLHFKKGDTWTELRRDEYLLKGPKGDLKQVLETKTEMTVESVESDGGAVVARKIVGLKFVNESPEGAQHVEYQGGKWTKEDWGKTPGLKEAYQEFVGEPGKLKIRSNAQVASVEDVEGFPKELLTGEARSPALLPEGRVRVGGEWESQAPEEGGLVGPFKLKMKLTEIRGDKAVVSVTLSLPEQMDYSGSRMKISGSVPTTMEFDLGRGSIVSQKGSGEFIMTAADPAGGADVEMRLKMSTETTISRP